MICTLGWLRNLRGYFLGVPMYNMNFMVGPRTPKSLPVLRSWIAKGNLLFC